MRPVKKAVLVSTASIMLLGLSGLSPAGVENPASGYEKSQTAPLPVVGSHLFVPPTHQGHTAGDFCITADRVMEKFALDIENVGGEIVVMTEGFQQDFADSWRRLVEVERVEVTLVLAHVIPDRGGHPIVDVVEIDDDGCALSRTLLSADDWIDLLERSRSIDV